MTYVFDIDGTLCTLVIGNDDYDYRSALPLHVMISRVNALYAQGHHIVLHTARGMGRTRNDPVLSDTLLRSITERQLTDWGVQYHELFFGKPAADVYVDDKAININDFLHSTCV